jgi:hypothetical protein
MPPQPHDPAAPGLPPDEQAMLAVILKHSTGPGGTLAAGDGFFADLGAAFGCTAAEARADWTTWAGQ